MKDDSILADLAKGALAGTIATFVMGKVTTYLYQQEDQSAKEREQQARGGKTAYGSAAEKLAHAAGQQLSEDERKKYGSAIHWVLGAGAGAAYGIARHRIAHADLGNGLLFGAAFWALVDEGANTALGLTPGPSHFPWQTHARGLAAHLVFGIATDTVVRLTDEIA